MSAAAYETPASTAREAIVGGNEFAKDYQSDQELNAVSERRPRGRSTLVATAACIGFGGFNTIDDFQVRSRGGFENIGADASAAIGPAVMFDRD